MKTMWKKITAGILLVVLLVLCCGCSLGAGQNLDTDIRKTANGLQKAVEAKEKQVLRDEEALPAGSPASDWTAMVLAFSGQKDAYADYLERLNQYVVLEYEQNGCLSEVKATEYHRISLTMLALGGDPTSIETADGTVIDLVADGTWNFVGGSPGLQGANGLAYALLTLDAKKYEPSNDAGEIRQKLVEELLYYQLESGAFCLDRSLGGDVDITAMALQALAPYQETPKIQEAVERALSWLSGQLTEDAGFLCYGEGSAESSAQVILALCALGIDPEQDTDFQKNGKTMLDGLKQYRRKDGTYQHTAEDEEENIMATYQSLLALEAVQRLENGKGWIFDFTAYEPPEGMTERN